MTKKSILLVLLVQILLLPLTFGIAYGDAQTSIDIILGRMDKTLEGSLNSPDWKKKYAIINKNIDNLQEILTQHGGKITRNPVEKQYNYLQAKLNLESKRWKIYQDAEVHLSRRRKDASQQAILDVGGEMIFRLQGVARLDADAHIAYEVADTLIYINEVAGESDNLAVIRMDFRRLKSIDGALKKVQGYKESRKDYIRALQVRREGLRPLMEKFAKLTSKQASLDGTYSGKIYRYDDNNNLQETGRIVFTVSGSRASGQFAFNDGFAYGTFSGEITPTKSGARKLTGKTTGFFVSKTTGKRYSGEGTIEGYFDRIIYEDVDSGGTMGINNPSKVYNEAFAAMRSGTWKAMKK